VRAQLAVTAIRDQARKRGLNNVTVEQADALVGKTRQDRRQK
jgi:hypothetical protein